MVFETGFARGGLLEGSAGTAPEEELGAALAPAEDLIGLDACVAGVHPGGHGDIVEASVDLGLRENWQQRPHERLPAPHKVPVLAPQLQRLLEAAI